MRDYTTNNYCDFLWISDLIQLKQNSQHKYTARVKGKNSTISVFVNVIIFGTIVEVKQIGCRGFLYYIDDGTGVIPCKHGEDQFEEVIRVIEHEQYDILNQTFQYRQNCEQSMMSEQSMNDSVFNDRSIQGDDDKKSQLMGLQSLWDDIYQSFTNLVAQYCIGDTVLIEGKMYNYFHSNQIYINSIRLMNRSEEIMKISIKLENSQDPLPEKQQETDKRMSGLMTFDHIHHLNARFPSSRDIQTPNETIEVLGKEEDEVMTPNLESTLTFDTFGSNV